MMKLLVLILLVSTSCGGERWRKETYPKLHTRSIKGRLTCIDDDESLTTQNWVCDPDNVLAERDKPNIVAREVSDMIAKASKNGYCSCKTNCSAFGSRMAIGVAIVGSLDIDSKDPRDKLHLLHNFGTHLRHVRWAGLGYCNNELIIVYDNSDQQIWLSYSEQGVWAERVTADCIQQQVIKIEEYLQNDHPQLGIPRLVKSLIKLWNNPSSDCETFPFWLLLVIVVVVAAIVLLCFILSTHVKKQDKKRESNQKEEKFQHMQRLYHQSPEASV